MDEFLEKLDLRDIAKGGKFTEECASKDTIS